MNVKEFIDECKLPSDWEEIVCMEALTGCSVCECRLIDNGKLIPGTSALRVYDTTTNTIKGVLVLCKDCAPQTVL